MEVGYPDARIPLIAVLILFLDMAWFGLSLKRLYPPLPDIEPIYGIFAWVCLGIGISIGKPVDSLEAFLYGLILGLLTYGTFNGTEASIRRDWRGNFVWIDTIWGGVVCGVSSVTSYAILESIGWVVTLSIGLAFWIIIAVAYFMYYNLVIRIIVHHPR